MKEDRKSIIEDSKSLQKLTESENKIIIKGETNIPEAKSEFIKEKLIMRIGTYYTKNIEFKYQVVGIDYAGMINAGNRRANINVGGFIKIEYKIKDPSVYSYVGKYVKVKPRIKSNSIEAKRAKESNN